MVLSGNFYNLLCVELFFENNQNTISMNTDPSNPNFTDISTMFSK